MQRLPTHPGFLYMLKYTVSFKTYLKGSFRMNVSLSIIGEASVSAV